MGYHKLKPGQTFTNSLPANWEEVLFVWKGSVVIKSHGAEYKVGEKEAAFISGRNELSVQNDSTGEAVVIQAQAPPPPAGPGK